MPATTMEVAKNNGIEWDEAKYKTDAVYNAKLGKLYFDQQLKDNNGNLAMAYAAYNAGPGNLQKAKDAAVAEGKPENWTAHLPQETQGYVAKNMKAFGAGDPNPKDKTSSDAEQMGAIRMYVNQSIATEQANRGKKMSDAEVSSYIDQLFAQQVAPHRVGFLGFHWTTGSSPIIGSSVGDIPSATKDALKAAFKRQGIDSPSDSDLLNVYFNTWPAIVRTALEIADMEPEKLRLGPPTSEAIGKMEETIQWIFLLDTEDERRLIWLRAARVQWKPICYRLGVGRTTAYHMWRVALLTIVTRLNAKRKGGRNVRT